MDVLLETLLCAHRIGLVKPKDMENQEENWAQLTEKFKGKLLSICKKV
jgi:hypothetical protein